MATYDELRGSIVRDVNDDKVGTLDEFYIDEETQKPTWITVKTGLFGNRVNFVPLAGVHPTDEGLKLAFTKEQVQDAPKVEVDELLEEEHERELYEYYQAAQAGGATGSDDDDDAAEDTDTANATATGDADAAANDGAAMTRSEEQLDVNKRVAEAGRVRLRKYVVTEDVNFTVPVSHEEVRVVREPIDDVHPATTDNGAAAELGEEIKDMTLHAEQVTVDKKVAPVERVRMEKKVVQDSQQVNDTVRKEQVEVEGDGDRSAEGKTASESQ